MKRCDHTDLNGVNEKSGRRKVARTAEVGKRDIIAFRKIHRMALVERSSSVVAVIAPPIQHLRKSRSRLLGQKGKEKEARQERRTQGKCKKGGERDCSRVGPGLARPEASVEAGGRKRRYPWKKRRGG